jgi:hypothetical protein
MTIFFIVVVIVFVITVLAVVAFGLYEMSPLPRRDNPYRDPVTHQRRHESPHLDDHTW